jgi:multidrug resistance protein
MRQRPPLVIIFLTVFVDLVGFGIVLPVMPFYAEHFGASAFQIGLMASSYSFMQFIFAPIWGRISDRIGRRPIIIMSLFGSAVSLFIFGLAQSLTVLFIARIFAGTFTANIPTAQAYIADVTTAENRAKGMGLIGAAFGLGFIFGPSIGGLLSPLGYSVPAFFASGLALINGISAIFLLPESRPREIALASQHAQRSRFDIGNLKAALGEPRLRIYVILFFLVTFSFANLEATFALLTERIMNFGAKENGYLFAFIGVVVAIVQGGLIGLLVKKFGESRLVIIGLAVLTIGFVALPHSPHLRWLLLNVAIVSIGSGVANPSINSLISRNTSEDMQGGVLGISQSLSSLARVLGPAWGGWAFGKWGHTSPYWSGATILVGCVALSMYANMKTEPANSR